MRRRHREILRVELLRKVLERGWLGVRVELPHVQITQLLRVIERVLPQDEHVEHVLVEADLVQQLRPVEMFSLQLLGFGDRLENIFLGALGALDVSKESPITKRAQDIAL